MIINDRIVLGAEIAHLPQFGDPDDYDAGILEYNKRITACDNMFRWLNERGILQSTAFRYLIEPVEADDPRVNLLAVRYAIDTNDLLPHRKEMEAAEVENAELACHYIFGDAGYKLTPCQYTGAVMLTWMMHTYRDIDGMVGASCEIGDIQSLSNRYVFRILDKQLESGPRAAINLMWDIYDELKRNNKRMEHLKETKIDRNVCPVCGNANTEIKDSWALGEVGDTVERRECGMCGTICDITVCRCKEPNGSTGYIYLVSAKE